MCSGNDPQRWERDRLGTRKREGKIKGDGTGASLTHCLHIGFGSTSHNATVPWKREGIVSIDVFACSPCSNLLLFDWVPS
jgi:hypothetical protein